MKSSLLFGVGVLLAFVMVLQPACSQNMFQYRCGPECKDTWCYYSLGCTNCKQRYCTMFTRRGPRVCVLPAQCPRNQECRTVLDMRICTRRRIRG